MIANTALCFLTLQLLCLCIDGQVPAIVIQQRPIGKFFGIYSTGPFDVTVDIGSTESVTVQAAPEIISYVETVVQSPFILVIRFSDTLTAPINFQGSIKILLTVRALTTLTVTGSGPLTVTGPIVSNDLQIESDGSGDIRAPLKVNNVNVILTGSGNLFTSGKVKNANINISGSGSVFGKDLASQVANIAIQASGDVALYCENDLSVWIAGSGSVQYGGNPTVNQQIIGSGSSTRV